MGLIRAALVGGMCYGVYAMWRSTQAQAATTDGPDIGQGYGAIMPFQTQTLALKSARSNPASGKQELVAMVKRINAEMGLFSAADVLAIIDIESSWNTRALSKTGARGLMQLMPGAASDRGYRGSPDGLYDPETNVRLGIAHLAWGRDYLRRRLGHEPSADEWIGAYNMGVGNIQNGKFNLGYVGKWQAARLRWSAFA